MGAGARRTMNGGVVRCGCGPNLCGAVWVRACNFSQRRSLIHSSITSINHYSITIVTSTPTHQPLLPAPMAERSKAYSRVHSLWLLVDHCVLRNWDRILVRAVKGLISRVGMVSICPLLWQRDVKLQQTNKHQPLLHHHSDIHSSITSTITPSP